MSSLSRMLADVLVGVLAATSRVWVDVQWWHRIVIGILVVLAMETIFFWLDNLESEHKEQEARKQKNRDELFNNWK